VLQQPKPSKQATLESAPQAHNLPSVLALPIPRRLRSQPKLTVALALLPICAAALLPACATAPTVEGWSQDTELLRDGLEDSLVELEEALVVAFPGGSEAEFATRSALETELRLNYAPVLGAWDAFADYALESEIATQEGGVAGTRRLRDGFHALHVALLETRIAEDFGIDADTHRSLLASLDRAATPATAFLMLHPFVEHLADATGRHAARLNEQLRVAEVDALLALQTDSAEIGRTRTSLRAEESRLADLMRRRAAGVGEVSGNPGKELRTVRADLEDVSALETTHDARRSELAAAFLAARKDARRAIEAFDAWASAHARVAEALRAGHNRVDFSRLHDLATEFAG
jgi:hypothetical protein